MDNISLLIPSKREYVSTARLTVSSVASNLGYDIEKVEDIKVAVGEALNNAVIHSGTTQNIEINMSFNNEELSIEIIDNGNGFDLDCDIDFDVEKYEGNGLGLYLMQSLMDKITVQSKKSHGTKVVMIKKI